MSKHRNYDSNTAFLDLLMNTLIAFVGLFALALVLISVKKTQESKNSKSHAEFLVTISWPEKFDYDIDLWVKDPDGHLCMFKRQQDGFMSLERDDTGHQSDIVVSAAGEEILYPDNREILSINKLSPGEYVVNVHAYSMRGSHDVPSPLPSCEVTVVVEKLNPFQTVSTKKIVLDNAGDERTACRFRLNDDGDVTEVNSLQTSLIDYGNTLKED